MSVLRSAVWRLRPVVEPLVSSHNSVIQRSAAPSLIRTFQLLNNQSSVTQCGIRNYCSSALQKNDALLPQQTVKRERDVLYHKVELEIRSSDKAVLGSYKQFITTAAEHLGINIGAYKNVRKPHYKRWTVLKSVFVSKKHMVQYEVRTYHSTISFVHLTGSTADTFLEYIQRNLPEGVGMSVLKERMEEVPDHLLKPPVEEYEKPALLADSTI